jgi:hypothetical protein
MCRQPGACQGIPAWRRWYSNTHQWPKARSKPQEEGSLYQSDEGVL